MEKSNINIHPKKQDKEDREQLASTISKVISESKQLAERAELSALSESVAQNLILKEQMKNTTTLVEIAACDVIDAMGMVFDQKMETINELRGWRKTIESEVALINKAVINLSKMTNNNSNLKEFTALIEKLNGIEPNSIIEKIVK